jgi:signal transduction histidine kinase
MRSRFTNWKIKEPLGKRKISLSSLLIILFIFQAALVGSLTAYIALHYQERLSIWLCFFAIGLATMFGMAICSYIVRAIARINQAAEVIASGESDRPLPGNAVVEFDSLAATLNSISQQWQTSQTQLREYISLLDKKVEAETQALREAKEAAESANDAKSKFLANISHELRTPLNAILGFAELMSQDSAINPIHREYLGIMRQSGDNLLELINDLLNFSKIEAKRVTVNLNKFNLSQMLEAVELLLRDRAATKGLNLHFQTASNVPRHIISDEAKLRQIAINLVSNAIQYTEKGSITLKVQAIALDSSNMEDTLDLIPEGIGVLFESRYNYRLNFAIEDTGLGIDAAEIESLFQPFVQAKQGKMSNQGTGLGLNITYNFVRLMGGEIFVSSTPEKGSVFRFYIPIEVKERSAFRFYIPL